MPWRECKPMDERLKFVARLLDGEKMSALCREFGISRPTGYKIFNRYKNLGLEGLEHRSRRPYRHANKLPFQIERTILQIKREHPSAMQRHPMAYGVPFASPNALFGLSRLSIWWLRLGIDIERIKPGHPEQNGRHERMHLTLKREATGSARVPVSRPYNHGNEVWPAMRRPAQDQPEHCVCRPESRNTGGR